MIDASARKESATSPLHALPKNAPTSRPSPAQKNAARSLSLVPTTTLQAEGDHRREQIIEAIVSAVARSPLSRRISITKLRAVLEQGYDRFVDGARFDFDPILKNILRDRRAREHECRVAIAAITERLAPLGVALTQRTIKSKRLGDVLIAERRLSQADLDRALRAQASVGGRLGRHLVKLGCISEGALAHYLSQQLDIPSAEVATLKRVRPELAELLPAELARQYLAVPLGISGGALKIAMADPTDRVAIDAIAARTGRHILPIVAPESAIEAALERAYGSAKIVRPRSVSISAGSGGDDEFQVVHTSKKKGDETARAAIRSSLAPSAGAPAISVEDRGDFFQVERGDLIHDDTSRADLFASLTRATTAAEVARISMKLLATAAPRAAAFLISGTTLMGAAHAGCDIAEEDLRNVSIQLTDSTLFATACTKRQVVAGMSSTSNVDDALLASLGVPEGAGLVCVPVVDPNQGKAVAVLLAAGEDAAILAERPFFAAVGEKACLALRMVALKRAILEQ